VAKHNTQNPTPAPGDTPEPRAYYGLTATEWNHLCQAAFENLPSSSNIAEWDIDAILTWCIPIYLDMRGIGILGTTTT
jgi:hypothetical protein